MMVALLTLRVTLLEMMVPTEEELVALTQAVTIIAFIGAVPDSIQLVF